MEWSGQGGQNAMNSGIDTPRDLILPTEQKDLLFEVLIAMADFNILLPLWMPYQLPQSIAPDAFSGVRALTKRKERLR